MALTPDAEELIEHVVAATQIDRSEASRLIEDVVRFYSETAQQFVTRRHAELRRDGLKNDQIFERIAGELAARPVAAPALSLRQLRRVVYG